MLATAVVLALLGVYKWNRFAPDPWFATGGGRLVLASVFLAAVSISGLGWTTLRAGIAGQRRELFLLVVANFLVLLVGTLGGETLVRAFAVQRGSQVSVRGVVLPPPLDWKAMTAASRKKLADVAPGDDWSKVYFAPDPLLGWVVGASRQTEDGLYASSPDGVRASERGYQFADATQLTRIALMGDSYTFGLEVPFEDSWAAQLQQMLGAAFQIRNYGVDGYGVDQAYLRLQRDAAPWQPHVIFFGISAHDVFRTVTLYPFVAFAWEMPYAKPRFVLDRGELRLLNLPLPKPDEIVGMSHVTDLPWLNYERGYDPSEWRSYPTDRLYIGRLVRAWFPTYATAPQEVTDADMAELNLKVLSAAQKLAARTGSRLVIAYMPSRGDFTSDRGSTYTRTAINILTQPGLEVVDLRPCLARVAPDQRFLDVHYSRIGNRAIGECVRDVLLQPDVMTRLQ
jgi:hypothetical protein